MLSPNTVRRILEDASLWQAVAAPKKRASKPASEPPSNQNRPEISTCALCRLFTPVLTNFLRCVAPLVGWWLNVSHNQKLNVSSQDTVLPTHSFPITKRCSNVHRHPRNVSRSGHSSFLKHEQLPTRVVRYEPRPQHYATDAVWYGYDDKQKITPGANVGSGDRQYWRPVEPVVVQLPGLMTPRMSRGAFFGRSDTLPFVSAKQKMQRGEARSKRYVKRLPVKCSQRVGAPFCSSPTTVRDGGMNCHCLHVADVYQPRK